MADFIPFLEIKPGVWVNPQAINMIRATYTRESSVDDEGKYRYKVVPAVVVTTDEITDGDTTAYMVNGDDVDMLLQGLEVINEGLAVMLQVRLDSAVEEAVKKHAVR